MPGCKSALTIVADRCGRVLGAALCASVAISIGAPVSSASEDRPSLQHAMTVAQAVATSRFMEDGDGNSVFSSPNGTRYVVMVIRGDVTNDRVEAEIYAGKPLSLSAAKSVSVVRLSSRGGRASFNGTSSLLSWSSWNTPIWINDDEVALRWDDSQGVTQVAAVDIGRHRIRYLTRSQTPVLEFDVDRSGDVIYAATVERKQTNEKIRMLKEEGFAVGSINGYSLADGNLVETPFWMTRRSLWMAGAHSAAAIRGLPDSNLAGVPHGMPFEFSPNGRWALVYGPANANTISHWKGMTSAATRKFPGPPEFWSLYLVDVHEQSAKQLWDAPIDFKVNPRLPSWSSDGNRVLLGPAYMPPTDGDVSPGAIGVAEVDLRSQSIRRLPLSTEDAQKVRAIRWCGDTASELTMLDGARVTFSWDGKVWRQEVLQCGAHPLGEVRVRIQLKQGLNDPPKLIGTDTSAGAAAVLLDPNPGLTGEFALGHVELIKWNALGGNEVSGILFYPVGFQRGRQYPLVVQTYGHETDETFSLYGGAGANTHLGPGHGARVAQMLSGRGIAVLQAFNQVKGGTKDVPVTEPQKTRNEIATIEQGIQALKERGIIDSNLVGIEGYSYRGWVVEYALSHSDFPYAAAIVSDASDGSYFQAGLTNWDWGFTDRIGSIPFGSGMENWLEESPAFNAERFRTPIQIQVYSGGDGFGHVLWSGWETFSRLRYLHLPAEMYVVPDVLHGIHGLQTPSQVIAVQERALDWWLFWLLGVEDPNPSKRDQYIAWKGLRDEQNAARETPRPPLLKWTSTPWTLPNE
jgi:hypothetical protein